MFQTLYWVLGTYKLIIKYLPQRKSKIISFMNVLIINISYNLLVETIGLICLATREKLTEYFKKRCLLTLHYHFLLSTTVACTYSAKEKKLL